MCAFDFHFWKILLLSSIEHDDDSTLQLKFCLAQILHEFIFVCGCLLVARLFRAMLVYVVLLEFIVPLMMSFDAMLLFFDEHC